MKRGEDEDTAFPLVARWGSVKSSINFSRNGTWEMNQQDGNVEEYKFIALKDLEFWFVDNGTAYPVCIWLAWCSST